MPKIRGVREKTHRLLQFDVTPIHKAETVIPAGKSMFTAIGFPAPNTEDMLYYLRAEGTIQDYKTREHFEEYSIFEFFINQACVKEATGKDIVDGDGNEWSALMDLRGIEVCPKDNLRLIVSMNEEGMAFGGGDTMECGISYLSEFDLSPTDEEVERIVQREQG